MASSVFIWPGLFTYDGTSVVFTNPLILPNGTAAAPSLAFASNTNRGLFNDTGNAGIGVAVGGSEIILLSAGGLFNNANVQLSNGSALRWTDGTATGGTSDTWLRRSAAKTLSADSDGSGALLTAVNFSASAVNAKGANGQAVGLLQLTELTTIAAAASTDTTILMPAGAIVMAVNVLVTTVIPTATSFTVGDSGSAARFNTANVGVAATSSDAGTKAGAYYNAGALAVRLTMAGGTPAANTGRVRVTIFYFLSTPPTS